MIVEPYKMLVPADGRFDWTTCPFDELEIGNCRMKKMEYGKRVSIRIRVDKPDSKQLYRLKKMFGRPCKEAEDYVALWANDAVWLQRELRLSAVHWNYEDEPEVFWRWIKRNYRPATR